MSDGRVVPVQVLPDSYSFAEPCPVMITESLFTHEGESFFRISCIYNGVAHVFTARYEPPLTTGMHTIMRGEMLADFLQRVQVCGRRQ